MSLPVYELPLRRKPGFDEAPFNEAPPATPPYEIWDPVRRKYVRLTPEEWVRQRLLHFLITERQYPAGCLAVERKPPHARGLPGFDILAYSPAASPLLLAECKAPEVGLQPAALLQLARYNEQLQAPLLICTNGNDARVLFNDLPDKVFSLANLPAYPSPTISLPKL